MVFSSKNAKMLRQIDMRLGKRADKVRFLSIKALHDDLRMGSIEMIKTFLPSRTGTQSWTSWLKALVLTFSILMPAMAQANDASQVAIVSTLDGKAEVVRGGESLALEKHSKIFANDVLKTDSQGRLGLIFRDNTVFTLGPDGEVTVDKFLFDPQADKLGFNVGVAKGAFSFVSGTIAKLKPEAVNLTTTTATIGIRGTYLLGKVNDPRVYVYSNKAGKPVESKGGLVKALFAYEYLGGDNLFVLLEDPTGKVGSVELRHPEDETKMMVLNEKQSASRFEDNLKRYVDPFKAKESLIKQAFGVVQDAEPEQPENFTLTFETGTAQLTADSQARLADIVASAKRRDSRFMSVVGHADRQGSAEFNLQLSINRAEAVLAQLTRQGLDESYFDVTSHGERNPVVPTADGVAEPRNRRVEVTVR